MVVMGGFMGAAALAVRQGNKKREQTKQELESAEWSRKQNAAIRAAAAEYDAKKSASKDASEAALGRPETHEEMVEREVKEFGFYVETETREERVARTLKSLGL